MPPLWLLESHVVCTLWAVPTVCIVSRQRMWQGLSVPCWRAEESVVMPAVPAWLHRSTLQVRITQKLWTEDKVNKCVILATVCKGPWWSFHLPIKCLFIWLLYYCYESFSVYKKTTKKQELSVPSPDLTMIYKWKTQLTKTAVSYGFFFVIAFCKHFVCKRTLFSVKW